LLALIACVLGMVGIGVVIVVGKEVLSTSFTSPDQARRTMKVEVLGEVAQIQTELEARRVRFNRLLQLAASLMLLAGMAATVWVCSRHPELLPAWLVDRASEFREGLV